MKKAYLLVVVAFLAGCGDSLPQLNDPHHPVDFDGKEMRARDWLSKFCADKPDNKKCLAVSHAMSIDSGKGGLPKGW